MAKLPDLDQLLLFATIAETGSFAKAGQKLGMPTTTVSRKLAELERLLGVELIHRTTRKLSMSTDGQYYLEQFAPLMREVENLHSFINRDESEPEGLIRITAPVSYGLFRVQNKLSEFQRRYPKVKLQVFLKNEYVDLVAEGFDVAIRVAPLADSSLIAKKIDSVGYCCVTRPDFLPAGKMLKTPDDLIDVPCIGLAPELGTVRWDFESPAGVKTISFTPQLIVNDPLYAVRACLQGDGIAYLPDFAVEEHLNSGELIQLLSAWKPKSRDIMIVFHHRRLQSLAIRSLLAIFEPRSA